MTWYVVRVATRRETRAAQSLREAGFEAYLPTVKAYNRLGRDKHRSLVHRPFLPGYLFAKIPAGAFRQVEDLDGVHAVVRFTTRCGERAPQPVSEALVAVVRAIVATGEFDAKPPPETKLGVVVRFTAGPLAGLIGKVKAAKRSGRLMVLLNADQRGAPVRPVEASAGDLEAVA